MRRVLVFGLMIGASACFSEFGIDDARFASGDADTSAADTAEVVTTTETTGAETREDAEIAIETEDDSVEHEIEGDTVEHETEDDTVERETEDDTLVVDTIVAETEDDAVVVDTILQETLDDVVDVIEDTAIATDAADGEVLGCPEDPTQCPVIAGDRCETAIQVPVPSEGVIVAAALDATFADDYQAGSGCGGQSDGRDLVWHVIITAPGDWSFTLTPDGFDVVMYAFGDTSCGACDVGVNQGAAGAAETFTKRGLAAGSELWIVADSPAGTGAGVTLEVRPVIEEPCSQAGTLSADRASVSGSGDLDGPTLTNALDPIDCGVPGGASPVPNQVFELVVPWTGEWHVRIDPALDLDPRWHIRTGDTCAESTCVALSDLTGAGEDEVGEVDLTGGETYWLVVDSASSSFTDGAFEIRVEPSAITKLADVRAALAIGTAVGPWTIDGAVVTALKPAVGTDPSGFFIQAAPLGPAMLVEATSATVMPGDVVTITLETLRVFFGASLAATSSGLAVIDTIDLGGWTQDISHLDPVTALGSLEAELIDLDGVVAAAPSAAGLDHIAANIRTAGYTTPSTSLRLRLPATGIDTRRLLPGCTFSLRGGFLWRFNATAQPSTYDPLAITMACPPVKVTGAGPASTGSVRVFFDRPIDPTSIRVDGSQFSFTQGLLALSATAEANSVLVTTSRQNDDDYVVVVATDVRDAFGDPIDPVARTASFHGFTGATGLVINEIDYDQSATGDPGEFIEILNGTSSALDMSGYRLELMSGASLYGTIPLSGSLRSGGYLVIARAALSVSADIVLRFEDYLTNIANGAIQNGPADGVRLVTTGGIRVDSILYEATAPIDGVSEGAPFASGEVNSDPNLSLQRCPDGADTDDNNSDFVIATPSAGVLNNCGL